MRGEDLGRLLIASHNFLAEVGGAPLQIRIAQRGHHGLVEPDDTSASGNSSLRGIRAPRSASTTLAPPSLPYAAPLW